MSVPVLAAAGATPPPRFPTALGVRAVQAGGDIFAVVSLGAPGWATSAELTYPELVELIDLARAAASTIVAATAGGSVVPLLPRRAR